ncbi:MAG: archease [Candidatus Diapherotrites archaeon]|nr:archease [Candidatus Diapherotrites archaeon]
MQNIEFLEHTADVKFKAVGKTMGECFSNSARALVHTLVDEKTISPKLNRPIELDAENYEDLLHKFLEEILFQFQVEEFLTAKAELKFGESKNSWVQLSGKIIGERINSTRHEIKTDVKAVTWNDFSLKKTKEGWESTVLLDV